MTRYVTQNPLPEDPPVVVSLEQGSSSVVFRLQRGSHIQTIAMLQADGALRLYRLHPSEAEQLGLQLDSSGRFIKVVDNG